MNACAQDSRDISALAQAKQASCWQNGKRGNIKKAKVGIVIGRVFRSERESRQMAIWADFYVGKDGAYLLRGRGAA